MTQIVHGMFIGNYNDANNRLFLTKNSISHIQNCAPEIDQAFEDSYQYKMLPMLNIKQFDPTEQQEEATDFINEGLLEGTGLLVHDFKGDSRTLGCIMAYFIKYKNETFDSAVRIVKSKKKDANLNSHFSTVLQQYQLDCYDRRCKGTLFIKREDIAQDGNDANQKYGRKKQNKCFKGEEMPENPFVQERDMPEINQKSLMNRTGSSFDKMNKTSSSLGKSKYKWENFVNGRIYNTPGNIDFDKITTGLYRSPLDTEHFHRYGKETPEQENQIKETNFLEAKLKELSTLGKQPNISTPTINDIYCKGDDQYRSKISRGQFLENCNGFDEKLEQNPIKGFYCLGVTKEQSVKSNREHSVKEGSVCNAEDNKSVVSRCESNRSLKFKSKGAVDADRFIGVVCKPFKTEYEHEYAGGRYNKDPRLEGEGQWIVPNTQEVQNIRKTILYRRRDNRISGVGLNDSRSNMASSQQNFRKTSANYVPIQNSFIVKPNTESKNSNIMVKKAHFKNDLQVFPYQKYGFEESLPINENLIMTSCNEMKAEPYIGKVGAGKKSIRIFSGYMGDRPRNTKAQKNPFSVNHAGKGANVHWPSLHPNSKVFFRSEQNDKYNQSKNYKTEADEKEDSVAESDHVWGHIKNKKDAANIGKTYELTPKQHNPFVVKRPFNTVVMEKKHTHRYNKSQSCVAPSKNDPKALNFSDPWTQFCRKNLSKRACQTCQACNHILVYQYDVQPHTAAWYKGQNQERNQTGFDEDDCDGGLVGTYSRLNARINTNPIQCDKVFVFKTKWMNFYPGDNIAHINCPSCKVRVGQAKTSGLRCNCGHWNIPGYALLKDRVRLNT